MRDEPDRDRAVTRAILGARRAEIAEQEAEAQLGEVLAEADERIASLDQDACVGAAVEAHRDAGQNIEDKAHLGRVAREREAVVHPDAEAERAADQARREAVIVGTLADLVDVAW